MATTKLNFQTVDENLKASSKTFGYVNPNATDYTLKSLVTGAYALSNNSVRNIYRVDTRDISNAQEESTPVISGKSLNFASTSDFFSTNSATFKSFLQSALAADSANGNSGDNSALELLFGVNDFDKVANINITYGELIALSTGDTATIHDIVTLINSKLAELEDEDEQVGVTATFSNGALSFTADVDQISAEIQAGVGATGTYILQSLYDNASDTSGFEIDEYSFNWALETE